MFIYGLKSVHLKTAKSTLRPCPNCSEKGGISISVFRRHFHIFWIPMFPCGKTGKITCAHCQKTMKIKKMPDNIKLDYQNLKARAAGPIWQFSGIPLLLVFILGLFCLATYNDKNNNEKAINYINSPKIGDVYEYKMATASYTTLKVVQVFKDSIAFIPNQLSSINVFKIYKLDKPENYTNDTSLVSKTELSKLLKTGTILKINRD